MAEEKEKRYIKYTAAELAAVPSPHQMEQELQQIWSTHRLGPFATVDVPAEYRLVVLLGVAGYVAHRKAMAAMVSRGMGAW